MRQPPPESSPPQIRQPPYPKIFSELPLEFKIPPPPTPPPPPTKPYVITCVINTENTKYDCFEMAN